MKALEELRTKEELINYFKQLGKEITEEELNALKQNYDKAQENNGALTMQQLDDVAGGRAILHITLNELGEYKVEGLSGNNFDKGKIEIWVHNIGSNCVVSGNLEQLTKEDPGAYKAISKYVLGHQGEENLGLTQSTMPNVRDMNLDSDARDRLISNLNEHFVQGNIARDDFEPSLRSIAEQAMPLPQEIVEIWNEVGPFLEEKVDFNRLLSDELKKK